MIPITAPPHRSAQSAAILKALTLAKKPAKRVNF
jgi:hypothetical protein